MKKVYIVLISILIIGFAGCLNEKDEKENIIGGDIVFTGEFEKAFSKNLKEVLIEKPLISNRNLMKRSNNYSGTNPTEAEIIRSMKNYAIRYDVPYEILYGIGTTESNRRQFRNNQPLVSGDGGIGMFQLTNRDDFTEESLKWDYDYNIGAGAAVLEAKFRTVKNTSWGYGVDVGDNERYILENWYFAVWAYNGYTTINNPNEYENGSRTWTVGGFSWTVSEPYQERVYNYIENLLGINITEIPNSDIPSSGVLRNTDIDTPTAIHYTNSGTWNGNASLISYSSGSKTGYGMTYDISKAHSNSDESPTVFFQWQVDDNDGKNIKISAGSNIEYATITIGAWNSEPVNRAVYNNVELPFIIDPTDIGFSVNDGTWFIIGVRVDNSPSSTSRIRAEATHESKSDGNFIGGKDIIVDGEYSWNGTGSIISYSTGNEVGYGVTYDIAKVHPSSQNKPAVFFQWQVDASDGDKLKIDGDLFDKRVTIKYGTWASSPNSRTVISDVNLPYTIEPLSASDGSWYVIEVCLNDKPLETGTISAMVTKSSMNRAPIRRSANKVQNIFIGKKDNPENRNIFR